jgi:hypothetical protein
MATMDLVSLLTNYSTVNNEPPPSYSPSKSSGLPSDLNTDPENNDRREDSRSEPSSAQTTSTQTRTATYFRRTHDLKLDRDSLFMLGSVAKPIPLEDDSQFTFPLNQHTGHVNILMWTVQWHAKAGKQRPLLVGYISLPVHELCVDCWLTSGGETRRSAHFTPIGGEEGLRGAAAVVSRITRSHVLSDHPGFDANVAVGMLTMSVNHQLVAQKVVTFTFLSRIWLKCSLLHLRVFNFFRVNSSALIPNL